jgi:hypothetical protein
MTRGARPQQRARYEHTNIVVRAPVEWDWFQEGERIMRMLKRSFSSGREINRIEALWTNALMTGTRLDIRSFLESNSPRSIVYREMLGIITQS